MEKEHLSRALDVCLESLQSGTELEQVLNLFPQWRVELGSLIKSAFFLQQMGEAIQLPDRMLKENRSEFLQAVQETVPATRPMRASIINRTIIWGFLLILAFLVGILGLGVLSSRALPGSAFYPFKEGSRQVRLLLTRDPKERIRLDLSYDQERVQEVVILEQKASQAAVRFGGNYSLSQEGDWLIAGLPVTLQSDTQLVGDIPPGIYVRVDGKLLSDGSIMAERIQAQQFLLRGVVETMTTERLVLAGLPVMITPETLVLGILMPGVSVDVTTVLFADELFSARLIKVTSPVESGIVVPPVDQ